MNGYFNCLIGGLPFLRTGIVADLLYSSVLFGTYYLMQKYALNKKAAV
jgi:hypothetical protein